MGNYFLDTQYNKCQQVDLGTASTSRAKSCRLTNSHALEIFMICSMCLSRVDRFLYLTWFLDCMVSHFTMLTQDCLFENSDEKIGNSIDVANRSLRIFNVI